MGDVRERGGAIRDRGGERNGWGNMRWGNMRDKGGSI